MNRLSDHPMPLGYRAFDRLRAEYEEPWLSDIFVEPLDFEAMKNMRSMIVFGASGSGKTALRLALEHHVSPPQAQPTHFVAHWQPSLSSTNQSGMPAVREAITQVLDICAQSLLEYLGQWPGTFTSAPEWVQQTIVWFVQQHLSGHPAFHVSRLEQSSTPQGVTLLHNLFTRTVQPILSPTASESAVIKIFAQAVHHLGFQGIWVFVDGLEPLVEAEAESLASTLKTLLSTLALFEDPGFVFKFLAPSEIEAALMSSGSIQRRRMDPYRLRWSVDQLEMLVERRLAYAIGRPDAQLSDLFDRARLMERLKLYGGHSPRGWLELLRPLVQVYLARPSQQPLTDTEWEELWQRYPPRLHLHLATNRVFIGYGQIDDVQNAGYKVLRYLYEQRHRLCSRSELYYRAHLGMDYEPMSPQDQGWEAPKQWSGTIDTILWRLRQKIELDPKNPVYILSDRGKGVHLENTM